METKSVVKILKLMNDKGYKTKTHISKKGNIKEGKEFNKNAVYKIPKNKLYYGIITSSTDRSKEFQGQRQAIIEEVVYNKAQLIFQENKNNSGNTNPNKNRTNPNYSNVLYL